jgi:filamentous hemagglutinin
MEIGHMLCGKAPIVTLGTLNSFASEGVLVQIFGFKGNPFEYTDPYGKAINVASAVIGAAVGGVIGAGVTIWKGGSVRDVAAAAVGGAVTGGLADFTMGGSVAVGLGGSALAGMAGYTASNLVSGNETTIDGLALSGASGAAGYATGEIIGYGLAKLTEGKFSFSVGEHISSSMEKRGWTTDSIERTLNKPARIMKAQDTRNLGNGLRMNDPATAYINKDGSYVVRNNRTGDIVQISNRNDSNWGQPKD